jgi:short-subunit dehydrogenase
MNHEEDERPVALVTGASSGIGAIYAERLASVGHDLVLVARRADRLEALAESLRERHGVVARILPADLSEDGGIDVLASLIEEESGLAVLVNDAGFSGYGRFAEIPPERIDRLIEIHCRATTRLTRAALPGMLSSGRGDIVNMGSLLAFSRSVPPDPLPYRAVYAACKAFIVAFTVTLHHELEGTGVRLMACCPGLVESEFHGPNWQGPPQMSAEDVVTACFEGLEAGEAICLPSIEDAQVLKALDVAERAMIAHTRVTTLASRYR